MAKKDREIPKLGKPLDSKVIGLGEADPEQLLANPYNWRIHPDYQQEALAGSIDQIGFIDPVLVNQNTGTVVDGHLRVALSLRSGEKSIPVIYLDLTEEEERLALLSLDPIAAMAGSDRGKVDELLRLVNTDDERVLNLLTSVAEKSGAIDVIGNTEGEVDQTRTNNNLSKVNTADGTFMLFQFGDIMVVLPAELYNRVWGVVNGPDFPDRKTGITAVLERGLNAQSGTG